MPDSIAQLEQFLLQLNWVGLTIVAIAGLVVALTGYRLRLLFFFVVGFYLTAPLVGTVLASFFEFPQAFVVFGTIGGLLGGLVAVRLYVVALFLVGVPIGAAVMITVVSSFVGAGEIAIVVAAIVGAVVGGVVTIALDRVMVIAASAILGAVHAGAAIATLAFQLVVMSQTAYYATFIGVAVVILVLGIVYQGTAFPRRAYVFGPKMYADQRAYGDSVSRQYSKSPRR
ncbi:MAG: hypothetical protein ACLFNQ_09095 [Spirochaetaceae bacterium]